MWSSNRSRTLVVWISRITALGLMLVVAPMYADGDGDHKGFADGEQRWILRAGALLIKSTGDEAGSLQITPPLPTGASREKSVGNGPGLGLSAEYMLRQHLGLEGTLLIGSIDAGLSLNLPGGSFSDSQDIDYTALTFGLNYHFTPSRRADYYAGFHAQSSSFDDLIHQFPGSGHGATVTFNEALGWSVKIGVDVDFGPASPWTFSASAQHLREPLDVKPVVAWVGVGYRL